MSEISVYNSTWAKGIRRRAFIRKHVGTRDQQALALWLYTVLFVATVGRTQSPLIDYLMSGCF